MALLEVATRIAKKLNKLRLSLGTDSPRPIGGNIWSGFSAIFSSPYLLLLAAYLLLYLVAPGFIYFMKAELSREAFVDRSHRVAFFAQVELAANSLTLLLQVLVTGRVLKNLGVTAGLLILPLLTLILFAGLGMWTVLPIVVACDIARRVGNFAFAKPAREILYTVVSPEERYKSKTILDTVVYRGGDVAVGWFYSMLSGIGFAMSQIVWVVVPIAGLWATVGVILGRAHRRRAE
jgi:AAA family ATP:ADP antiporter